MTAAYFFDSNALVKRYYRETGADWIRAVCGQRSPRPNTIYICDIARVEVVAALRRIGQVVGAHPSSVQALVHIFERDITRSIEHPEDDRSYQIVPQVEAVIVAASDLCNRYWQANPRPLRSLDAIQLASALAVQAALAESLTLVTADIRLLHIAQDAGLVVADPTRDPIP